MNEKDKMDAMLDRILAYGPSKQPAPASDKPLKKKPRQKPLKNNEKKV